MTAEFGKSDRHPSSFHLELHRLGEASPEERAWIEGHLRGCARCAELAASFESHRLEFAARPAAAAPAARPAARAPRPAQRRIARIGLGVLLPAAAAVALFLSVRRPPPSPGEAPEIAAKGGAGFMLVARRGGKVFPVGPTDRLSPGDQIRFVVSETAHRYLLVGSIDGAGHASVYFPYEGRESGEIGDRKRFELPGSIVVDASPGPERFFALFSRQPLQTTSVRRALDAVGRGGTDSIRNASSLDVGADEQASILVEKETR